jgi:hypothetical protein
MSVNLSKALPRDWSLARGQLRQDLEKLETATNRILAAQVEEATSTSTSTTTADALVLAQIAARVSLRV